MKHLIHAVDSGSICNELGICAGDSLLTINEHDIADIFDYERAVCSENLLVCFELANGELLEAQIEKDQYEPLGLEFEQSLLSNVKQCKNKCLFCFIDQMPYGKRDRNTLHFKDDDWRLSLIMGNYITLTNVCDTEFERIIGNRVSPLYISVHTTDGDLRKTMMSNPTADKIMPRLLRLAQSNIEFNAQIVLCPELNDNDALDKTLNDLYSLYPAAQSVAVVPVGLTRHREGLYPLRCLTKGEALHAIEQVEALQAQSLKEHNVRFAYASDEMYIRADLPLPLEETYEYYPQIENGVGLLRKFELELNDALENLADKATVLHKYIGVCGVSAYQFLSKLLKKLVPYNIDIDLRSIVNSYFGENVTVSGLICACDIISSLSSEARGQTLLIPSVMLREGDDVFLDGLTVAELESALECTVLILPCYDGRALVETLFYFGVKR